MAERRFEKARKRAAQGHHAYVRIMDFVIMAFVLLFVLSLATQWFHDAAISQTPTEENPR